jgi:hypothetical protein
MTVTSEDVTLTAAEVAQAAARRAAVLGALKARVDAEVSAARADLDDAMRAVRKEGVDRVEVTVSDDLAPDGQRPVATAAYNRDGKPTVSVTHMGDAVEWVARYHPGQIREVIDPVWLAGLLKRLVIEGGHVVDPDTGEVLEWARPVPGARGSLVLKFAGGDEGREAIADAWYRGEFWDISMPALAAPPSPGAGRVENR